MTDLRAGSTQITDIKSGSTNVNEVYVGSSQVWTRTLIDPETGWNDTSGTSTNEQGANYTNGVTMTQNATLKVTISGSSSGQFNFAAMDIKTNASSNFPVSGASPHRWGYQGFSYGTERTINVVAGNVIRFYGFIAQSGTGIDVTATVKDGSDNSVIDTVDIDHFDTASGGGTCFLADSLVTMQDLSKKRIADMQVGDIVLGDGGVANEVIELRETAELDQILFAINHLKTTESHPIKTESGWKAINPEAAMILHPEMTITQIAIGDRLACVNDSGESYFEDVATITSETVTAPVYNLNVSGSDTPEIDGNDTYIVDGVMVHNK